MLEENKNLKDTHLTLPLSCQERAGERLLSYKKTNKLVSALYIVTDIMDKEEPLRNKFRNLGTDIISDIHSFGKGHDPYDQMDKHISEILALLEIASSVGIVSAMNSGILTKEFNLLRKSATEASSGNEENWLEEFISSAPRYDPSVLKDSSPWQGSKMLGKRENPIGHSTTRIGLQKGGTLLKALSSLNGQSNQKSDFNNNKNKRQEEIISIIKDKMKSSQNFEGVTITDIKSIGQNLPAGEKGALASCGEKTLQRELVSLVSGGVLKKTGEKRWSRYSLK